jgi:hypothetical protein
MSFRPSCRSVGIITAYNKILVTVEKQQWPAPLTECSQRHKLHCHHGGHCPLSEGYSVHSYMELRKSVLLPCSDDFFCQSTNEGVSKIFRTGHLERELQMVHLSATRYSCVVVSLFCESV